MICVHLTGKKSTTFRPEKCLDVQTGTDYPERGNQIFVEHVSHWSEYLKSRLGHNIKL